MKKLIKAKDLKTIQLLISGYGNKTDKGVEAICLGLRNEKGLTEGTKRILTKINNQVTSELEILEKQVAEAGEDESKIKEINEMEIPIEFTEVLLFSKVADLSFSYDYSLLFPLISEDY